MSGTRDLKLLGTKESLFTHRVVWALKLKGIEYEFIEVDLLNKSPLLLELNPVHKKVPVLVHAGKTICESLVILEYIDENWKDGYYPLLPQDPLAKAYARFWAKFVDEKFYQGATAAFFSTGENRAKGIESVAEALQVLEGEIQGKKFFGGETIGFLDIAVGWIAYWFQFVEEVGDFKVMNSTKYPSFDSWTKQFLQVSIIKENLPPPEAVRCVFVGFKNMAFQAKNAEN
ncbi:hypothetical protein LguiA_026453 [Lonicera macranthoides]